jgi:hypothetical protein
MPRRPPVKIRVYDSAFAAKGTIGDPKFVTITQRYNTPGTATVGIPSSHRQVENLITPGARLVYLDEDDQHLMSGYVTRIRGKGPTGTGQIEVDITDDLVLLTHVLGWVIPGDTIMNQGLAGENWVLTGPAETVLKTAVQENAIDRLAMPLTIATDLGRGSDITAKLRFHNLFDRIFPVVDGAGLEAAGIGVTIKQVEGGLLLDCFEPNVYPRDLTEAGGAIVDWSYTLTSMTASRVAVGGQGEAQARAFRYYIDAAREAQSGRKIEVFRDARDVDDVADLPARGQQSLDDGAPKAGLSMTLAQTKNLRYGKSVSVGDKATFKVGPNFQITDVLTEAVMSWTADDGWKVTPKVGDREDTSDTMIATALRRMARWISNQART